MSSNNEKLYLYCSFSATYDTLHGMYEGGLATGSFRDIKEIAHSAAVDVIDSYDCIMNGIYEDANQEFDYVDTPDDPSEDYLDYVEDRIQEEVGYIIFEVTEAGRTHTEEMEDDPSDYANYEKEGWLVRVLE